jgi:hypothetical protein
LHKQGYPPPVVLPPRVDDLRAAQAVPGEEAKGFSVNA